MEGEAGREGATETLIIHLSSESDRRDRNCNPQTHPKSTPTVREPGTSAFISCAAHSCIFIFQPPE